jgi:hypothetical protein
MATSTYLSNPGEVLIGAVDVTDQCTAATLRHAAAAGWYASDRER